MGGTGVGMLHQEPQQGAAEGAPFIARHLIDVATIAFDDFAVGQVDQAKNRKMLGLKV